MSARPFLAGTVVAITMTAFAAIVAAQGPVPVSAPAAVPSAKPAVASSKAEVARPAKAEAAVSSGPAFPFPDKGTFRILLSGSEVGSEQFEASSAEGAAIVRSETVIHVPGSPETRSSGELRVAADGTPLGYTWAAQSDKKTSGSVEFVDGATKTFVNLGDGKDPYEQDFMFPSPHLAILDSNLHYQYALLGLLYNWSAKGQQSFPVLIPQDVTPGAITVESIGPKTVGGATFDALRVNTADLEIITYFDAKRRLMRVEVPSANVAVVRR